MKREVTEAREASKGQLPADPWLLNNCPSLVEHMVDVTYDDGALRETSTLTVFIDAGVLKIGLNDRDNRRTLYVSGPDLGAALESLERALKAQTPDWRPWKGADKKRR